MGGRGHQKKRDAATPAPVRARGLTPLHREHGEKLRWHWGTVESDSGLRSSHAALVEMIRTGPSQTSGRSSYDEAAVRRVDDKRKAQAAHRRVEAALDMLPGDEHTALLLAYGPHIIDPAALGPLAKWGDVAPVASLSPAAKVAHAEVVARAQKRAARIPPLWALTDAARKLEERGVWGFLLTRRAADSALLAVVQEEARALLRAAHEAFATAYGGPVKARRAVTKRVRAETFSPTWAGG